MAPPPEVLETRRVRVTAMVTAGHRPGGHTAPNGLIREERCHSSSSSFSGIASGVVACSGSSDAPGLFVISRSSVPWAMRVGGARRPMRDREWGSLSWGGHSRVGRWGRRTRQPTQPHVSIPHGNDVGIKYCTHGELHLVTQQPLTFLL